MKKKINSQKSTSTVLFSLPKSIVAGASSVIVVGDFSEWNPIALKAKKDGSFAVEIDVPLGREYHFRYQVDGSRWENDTAADRYETSPIYGHIQNSVLDLVNIQTASIEPKVKLSAKTKAIKAATEAVATTTKTTKGMSKLVGKVVSQKVTSAIDDLTKIEGIGPKIAELLKSDGIETFEKLAKSGVETVKDILTNAGKRYQMHDPSTWVAQAKLAAKNDWESLKKWQNDLKGGKTK